MDKLQRVAEQIEKLNQEIDEFERIDRKEIEDVARTYSSQKSSFLAAVVGGIIGSGVGVGIGTVAGSLAVITGPAGMLLGAALAVLAWRGKNYQKLEKATEKLGIALNELENRISNLPEDAPRKIKSELWKSYDLLIQTYREIAVESLSENNKKKRKERTAKILPPVDEE